MEGKTVSLVIIIPAFNESERIVDTVTALRDSFSALIELGVHPKIFVVDDGSTDETGLLAEQAGADRVLHHKLNRGLGAAVRTGLTAARAAQADIALKFDADLQHDPRDIPSLIEPILQDEADIVYGHRFERIGYRMPFVRRMGNRVFTGLMRFLTGWDLKDSQPGIFAVDKAYLDAFRLPGDYNYTQQILLDAYHKGMRFAHRDVEFRKRETGKSFVSFKYPIRVLPQIFWVIVGVKPMKIFGPVGFFFLMIGLVVGCVELGNWFLGGATKPIMHVNAVLGSTMFGLQVLLFGVLAELIIQNGRR